ncbi:MAG: DinB family protein [Nakamurella sp.]
MTETPQRRSPDRWLDPDDDPRDGGADFGEPAVLAGYLRHYRQTLELKCSGLTAQQLACRSVPPSTLSLLGLLRHMARVEHTWAVRVIEGRSDLPKLYWTAANNDLDFDGAIADDAVVDDGWATWRREVAHAEQVYATKRLDDVVLRHGERSEIRDIVVHMIEEYARHCGHADLLRECVDGRTGQ